MQIPTGDDSFIVHAFRGASNIVFGENSSIVISTNSYVQHEPVDVEGPALEALYKNVAYDSIYGSMVLKRYIPGCLEGTRIDVLDIISHWVESWDNNRILWLTGPAGSGKSAIASSIAGQYEKPGMLAATYFFSRSWSDDARQKKGYQFITTLAYQLLEHGGIPDEIGGDILEAIHSDEDIFDRGLPTQLEELILKPLRRNLASNPDRTQWPKLIVVDGLDECEVPNATRRDPPSGRENEQKAILNVLKTALDDLAFPFRILISTRPQPHLGAFFSTAGKDITFNLFLDQQFNPDPDIVKYFKAKFALFRSVRYWDAPEGWPLQDPQTIEDLVKLVSGQFIVAVCIFAFVTDRGIHPETKLRMILGRTPSNDLTPFAELDGYFARIVQGSQESLVALNWLCAIESDHLKQCPAAFIRQFLSSSSWEEEFHLANLASLISIPELDDNSSPYAMYHQAFKNLLSDKARYNNLIAELRKDSEGKHPTAEPPTRTMFLMGRYMAILKNKGPNISVSVSEREAFLTIFAGLVHQFEASIAQLSPEKAFFQSSDYLTCDAEWWTQTLLDRLDDSAPEAIQNMHKNIHRGCTWPVHTPACKHWRAGIVKGCKARGWSVSSGTPVALKRAS